ncbi:MAG: MMPL family transporter [Acidobacteriota bacterium]|nr:MMPL family transporter [Acidobacteriota bacterium]
MNVLVKLYDRLVLRNATVTLTIVFLVAGFFAWQTRHFKLDASSDSLLLEDDSDLRYYQRVMRDYGSDDYLLITWTPKQDMFSAESRARLAALVEELQQIESVASVDSILNMPLFHSPDVPLMKLALGGYETLSKETVDVDLAKIELTSSPIYRELLINGEGDTSAMQLTFQTNEEYTKLSHRRQDLTAKKYEEGLTPEEAEELAEVKEAHRAAYTRISKQWDRDVARVREIMAGYTDDAQLFLGGVPMITSDMISYVENDLVVFGIGVLLFLIATLSVIFRRIPQVVMPMFTCITAGLVMIGFLGLVDWRVTVISSNFVSLLFIITMSFSIHFVVRYREMQHDFPEAGHHDWVADAARLVAVPCLYCALTTMVGFGSLIVSGIKPVEDFGLMMAIGIGVAYLLVFTFFPAALMFTKGTRPPKRRAAGFSLTHALAAFTHKRGPLILVVALVLAVGGGFGISRLSVENRFIDYFKEDTEIYRGMLLIDEEMGGTTPLEIILDGGEKDYWFKAENRDKLRKIHTFLDELPETGKVLSLDSTLRVGEKINGNKPLNDFLLRMIRTALPQEMKQQILKPFVKDDFSQVRINVRVLETNPDLKRAVLVEKIATFLEEDMGFAPENYRLTGLYILYNNLLQSLFDSQIKTIAVVFLATWLMFSLLFRSFYLALIAVVPNVFPVVVVLGTLGWLGIPLDIMTVTVAAITIGIAVDHTIHYIHRFKKEYATLGNYVDTVYRCHGSIGNAMYYTSITIIVGFSILSLSNFIPTIYFGLFTGLAMIVAMLAAMTLLPRLLIVLKPLGPERVKQDK